MVDKDKDKETLDPEDWDSMRSLGYQMIDDVVDYLASVRERPPWKAPTEQLNSFLSEPLPQTGSEPAHVYEQFREQIMPYALGNPHPRFWAWYMGNGTIMGAYAEMLAATMNPNTGAGHHGAMWVERQVLGWIKGLLNFPVDSAGLLVSGGSMANLVGLAVARNTHGGRGFRREGYQSGQQAVMRVYASTEVHSCNQKAIELMGMGYENLVKIPVNAEYEIDIRALESAIQEDIENGFKPICVIATAGTVNTGAIDAMPAIADLCDRYGLWFHVDGAIGAIAMLSDTVRPMLESIERADSVALDLHKWLHVPFEAGCVIVREGESQKDTFSLIPEYLAQESHGVASGKNWFSEYGVQLSRQFRALKIWMTFKEHGAHKLGRMMSKNVEQAKYLKRLVENHDELELCAPVVLDIVCYRWVGKSELDVEALNAINKRILIELQESGVAVPSYTTLKGIYCIRVAISNHRSRQEDFDLLVQETVKIATNIFNKNK